MSQRSWLPVDASEDDRSCGMGVEEGNALIAHSAARRAAYEHEILPLIDSIISSAERILGASNDAVSQAREISKVGLDEPYRSERDGREPSS